METTTAQKLVAELLGTFVLVFFGVGTALMWGADPLITALAFGLSFMVMVYAVGRVSGGHFNPAVSVGLAMGGRIPWREVPPYVGAQVGGGILAACVLFGLKQGGPYFDTTGNFGQNFFGGQGGWEWWSVFLLEVLLTAIFVFVIIAVTDTRNNANTGLAPLTIGITLALIHMASLGADGTSVNPARSIGPALFAGTDSIIQLWLFILAPLIGGLVAGLAYPAIYGYGEEPVVGSGRPRRGPAAATPGYDPYAQPWTPEQLAAAGWTPEQITTWQQQQGYAPQASAPQTPAPHTPAPETAAPSWPEGGDPERTQIRE
jgi:aquaporin Z